MTKEIEEDGQAWTISELPAPLGVVVWRKVGESDVYDSSGYGTIEEAEKYCRRKSYPFSVAFA